MRTDLATGTTMAPWSTAERKRVSTETNRTPAANDNATGTMSCRVRPRAQVSSDPAEVADTAVRTAVSTATSDCVSSAAPSMALALRLIAWNEPSRISPNISGRKGMMPGLGGAT